MSKITRLSTTLTARYSPASGATDAFWLDGRITGPRESRAADITLDREDKGFFFATFATQSSGDIRRDLDSARSILEKTTLEIKHSGKTIDNQITDLAECSVGVTGRMSVQHEGVRQPFFAGIMVKDSEIAAVTMGRGCAYLYRNDTLYPLTKDDTPFEAIDFNGKNIPNIDIYCAGVAGTVRYSNIAQLQVDDCIIVCNREVMEAIGQREMLRILYEAQDQCDAAGMVITAAASKLPGTPLQFMIGFVENIAVGEKTTKSVKFPIASKASSSASTRDDYAYSKMEEPFDEDYEQPEEPREDTGEPYDEEDQDDDDTGKSKKLALIAVIAIVLIACGIAIYTLTRGNRGQPSDSSSASQSASISGSSDQISSDSSADSSLSPSASVSASVSSTSAASTVLPAEHLIQPGELLSNIALKYYRSSDAKYLDAIIAANKTKYPTFTRDTYQQGWTITIPVVN